MFTLVALMCLYLGINNLYKAFRVSFYSWHIVHYGLAITGICLLVVCFFCIRQAIKDYNERKQNKDKENDDKQI